MDPNYSHNTLTFETVQLLKQQVLGIGSYGSVCKAKCDELLCAAKIIHPTLLEYYPMGTTQLAGREHRMPVRRFEQECQFLCQIRHPNIVQYLGMYRDPETNAPVLLMELMDESLTHFLEASPNPILFHIQVNILCDTASALAFLHKNNIIHRDVSSNNVLLIAGSRAKVTDFGMATLTHSAASHRASMTLCPGTDAYMAPEAVQDPPRYSEKVDCFSYGVLTVQVITQLFPTPRERYKHTLMTLPNTSQPCQMFIAVPEVERRQNHISLISGAHPLLPIALDCLRDRDTERPSAHEICARLEELKAMPLYAASIQGEVEADLQLQTQRQTNQENDEVQDQQQMPEESTQDDKQTDLQEEHQQLQQSTLFAESDSEELASEFQQGMTQDYRQRRNIQSQMEQLELISDDEQWPEVKKKPYALLTQAKGKDHKPYTTLCVESADDSDSLTDNSSLSISMNSSISHHIRFRHDNESDQSSHMSRPKHKTLIKYPHKKCRSKRAIKLEKREMATDCHMQPGINPGKSELLILNDCKKSATLQPSTGKDGYVAVLYTPSAISTANEQWDAVFAVYPRDVECGHSFVSYLAHNLLGPKPRTASVNFHFSPTNESVLLEIQSGLSGYDIESNPEQFVVDKKVADAAVCDYTIYPPRCILTIIPTSDSPPRLSAQLTLHGAVSKSFLMLKLPRILSQSQNNPDRKKMTPQACISRPRTHRPLLITLSDDEHPLFSASSVCSNYEDCDGGFVLNEEPTVNEFMRRIGCLVPGKWEGMAYELGLQYREVELIKMNFTTGTCGLGLIRAVFIEWKKQSVKIKPSWHLILKALRSRQVNERVLADQVKKHLLSKA